ncbi:MAG TPA: TetR/AcrR family transcriptional regulator [Thermomicrobiales bacterium]|nr:TetR/AcrR family transcriptional regulator [Thermomicrobiales bacterium]
MATTSDTAPPRTTGRPGRPRSARADRAILDAALELLGEVGINGLTIEGVAARAGVGKTTIYRRWASKDELIAAVVECLHATAPIPDTGDLRADLLTLARSTERGDSRRALERVLPHFLSEANSNPEIFHAYLETSFAPRVQRLSAMIARAQARGEVRADLDPEVVMSLFGGALTYGWLIADRLSPLPPDFAEQVVAAIWRGIAAPDAEGRRQGSRTTRVPETRS